VANRKPAFARQISESDPAVQVFLQELKRSTLLPRRQSTAICLNGIGRWSVLLGYMRAKKKAEIIEEELAK
jgi:hypothetical protein